MGILRGLKNSVAFLTVVPVGMDADGFTQAATYMPLFPIVGAMIGLICGALVWALDLFLPSLITGMLGLGSILLLTGVHHTDGLLDFGDAIISHASREDKIRIMSDPYTGAGGLSLGLVVLATTALGIAALDPARVIQSLVGAEAAAKFAMVFQAWGGKSAHKGLNTPFVKAMHGQWRWPRLAISFGLLLVISVLGLQFVGAALALGAILIAGIMLIVSNSAFGGVTGDVMGATNDLTRLVSLLVIVVAERWAL